MEPRSRLERKPECMKIKTGVILALLFSACVLLYLVRHRRSMPTDSLKRTGSSQVSDPATAISPANNRPMDELPLDLAALRVEAGFQGHNIEKIYKNLEDVEDSRVKGTYETPQYRERIEQLVAAPVLGELNRTSIYAFAVDNGTLYDADHELLTVKVPIYMPGLLPAAHAFRRGYMAMHSLSMMYPDRNYVGRDAYDASIVVNADITYSYYVAFRRSVGLKPQDHDYYVFRMHVPISEARDAAKKLGVVVVCRLVPPFTDSYEFAQLLHRSTISDPKAEVERYKYVSVDIVDLWLYEIATGKILQKLRNPSFNR